ncbi:hypothetical protein V6N12_050409 [Hibiscus sabdariffa]|uniref:Uncharacterized protein n=1 Tax=Hibiscus sabdariffa TaxID=183260 RepID=A0ABR2GDI8_9ROSI
MNATSSQQQGRRRGGHLQKKGSLPRLLDSPSLPLALVVDEDIALREKLSLGGVGNEAISIKTLAQEMVAIGLDGFEIMWVEGSMVLLALLEVSSRLVWLP